MSQLIEAGLADLEDSTLTATSGSIAAQEASIPLCPFLETVDYSDTHWTVEAKAPGRFTFIVTEGNQVVGTVSYVVIVGNRYRMGCGYGQVIRISC